MKGITCLRVLNIIAIIVELVAGCYIILSGTPSPFYEMTIVYHSVSLFWSIIYHMIPFIRTNFVYIFLAQIVCSVAFMLLIANVWGVIFLWSWGCVYLFITKVGWDAIGYLVMIIYFTGPSGLVAITLTIMINTEALSKEKDKKTLNQVVYVPADQQNFFIQPSHKLM